MNLLEFPVEIISALLELADPRAVVLCRGACKELKDMIDKSPSIQYKLALHIHGMVDNPDHPAKKPPAEKLAALQDYARAREMGAWTYTKPLFPYTNLYEIRQGFLVSWDSPRLCFVIQRIPSAARGIEHKEWSVPFNPRARDMRECTTDPSQDLLLVITAVEPQVAGESLVLHSLPLGVAEAYKNHRFTCIIQPTEMALTMFPPLHDWVPVGLQVMGDLVGISIIARQVQQNESEGMLVILNWRSGQTMQIIRHTLQTIMTFMFLSPSIILYPNVLKTRISLSATKFSNVLLALNLETGVTTRFDISSTTRFNIPGTPVIRATLYHGASLSSASNACGPSGNGYFSVNYEDPVIALAFRESLGTSTVFIAASHLMAFIDSKTAMPGSVKGPTTGDLHYRYDWELWGGHHKNVLLIHDNSFDLNEPWGINASRVLINPRGGSTRYIIDFNSAQVRRECGVTPDPVRLVLLQQAELEAPLVVGKELVPQPAKNERDYGQALPSGPREWLRGRKLDFNTDMGSFDFGGMLTEDGVVAVQPHLGGVYLTFYTV